MAFTAEQETEFKRLFAIRRRRQMILTVPVFAVFLAMIFLRGTGGDLFGLPAATLAPILLVLVVGTVIFSFRNWRCPACDKYLGRGLSPKFCARCGVPLV